MTWQPPDWAPPGQAADPRPAEPLPADPSAARPGPPPAEADSAAWAAPMVERGTVDLVDGAFDLLRARPRPVLALGLLAAIPAQLALAWGARDTLDLESFSGTGTSTAAEGTPAGLVVAAYAWLYLGYGLALGALAWLVAEWHRGRDPSAGALTRHLGRRLPALLAVLALTAVLTTIGLLGLAVGAAVVAVFLWPAPAILLVEDVGPLAALRRSARLVRRRFWATTGAALVAGVVAWAVQTALSTIPQLLAIGLGDTGGWIVLGLGSMAASTVSLAGAAGAGALLYYDLRVRREGLDLELAAIDAFDR